MPNPRDRAARPFRTVTIRAARAGRAARALVLLLPTGLVACDIPTGLPRFETRIAIPVAATVLSVSQLVPGGVIVTPTAFQIGIAAAHGGRSLGQMCGTPCAALHGQQAPKPAFMHVLTLASALPGDVATATLTSGEAVVTLSHSFGYDPLRPPGSTSTGVLRVVLRSAGREVGRDSIMAFAGPVTRTIELVPGAVDANVTAEVTILSPAGGTVTIDTADAVQGGVQPRNVHASSVQVTVQNRAVSADALSVDLTEVDDGLRDRVQRGSLIVALDNPFRIAGAMELRLNVPGVVDVRRDVQLEPGASTIRLDMTLDEVRALLGRTVDISFTGVVSQMGGPVTVLPTDAATIAPTVNLILEIGS